MTQLPPASRSAGAKIEIGPGPKCRIYLLLFSKAKWVPRCCPSPNDVDTLLISIARGAWPKSAETPALAMLSSTNSHFGRSVAFLIITRSAVRPFSGFTTPSARSYSAADPASTTKSDCLPIDNLSEAICSIVRPSTSGCSSMIDVTTPTFDGSCPTSS